MISLIKADLYRILRKKTLWIILFIIAGFSVWGALLTKATFWNGFAFAQKESSTLTSTGVFLLGLVIFISVYSDEFASKSMVCAIGRGISRPRVIFCKILSCTLLSLMAFAILLGFNLLLSIVMGAHMTGDDLRYLVLSALKGAYSAALCSPLAAIFIYLTGNRPLSVFVELLFLTLLPYGLVMLEGSALFSNLHPTRYTVQGFANRGFSELMLTGTGALTLIAGFLLYAAVSFLLSTLVFYRKELDF